jgi:hypothetical protein
LLERGVLLESISAVELVAPDELITTPGRKGVSYMQITASTKTSPAVSLSKAA